MIESGDEIFIVGGVCELISEGRRLFELESTGPTDKSFTDKGAVDISTEESSLLLGRSGSVTGSRELDIETTDEQFVVFDPILKVISFGHCNLVFHKECEFSIGLDVEGGLGLGLVSVSMLTFLSGDIGFSRLGDVIYEHEIWAAGKEVKAFVQVKSVGVSMVGELVFILTLEGNSTGVFFFGVFKLERLEQSFAVLSKI